MPADKPPYQPLSYFSTRRPAAPTDGATGPEPLPPDHPETLRETLARNYRESEEREAAKTSTPPPLSHSAAGGTSFTVFDYLGLGFILEPPGVVVHAVMTGEPLRWSNALYAIPFIAVGAISIAIGRNWETLKKRTSIPIVTAVDRLSRSYIVPFVVCALVLGGIATLPILIWPAHPAQPIQAAPVISLPQTSGPSKQAKDPLLPLDAPPIISGMQAAIELQSLRTEVDELKRQNEQLRAASQQRDEAVSQRDAAQAALRAEQAKPNSAVRIAELEAQVRELQTRPPPTGAPIGPATTMSMLAQMIVAPGMGVTGPSPAGTSWALVITAPEESKIATFIRSLLATAGLDVRPVRPTDRKLYPEAPELNSSGYAGVTLYGNNALSRRLLEVLPPCLGVQFREKTPEGLQEWYSKRAIEANRTVVWIDVGADARWTMERRCWN